MDNKFMELRPQDVLVALKLAVLPEDARPTYASLAADLGMSASEVHAAVKRAKAARLVFDWDKKLRGNKLALLEFAIHGVKYAFPAERGGMVRGIPTAYAAPPLSADIVPDRIPLLFGQALKEVSADLRSNLS
jgi:DNA-binding Lrp family transcriptional regulator